MPPEQMISITEREDGGYDLRCYNSSRHNHPAFDQWYPGGTKETAGFRVRLHNSDSISASCKQCGLVGSRIFD